MLGDHYYFRKCEPYEGSARVPLLVRGSAGLNLPAGVVSDTPACLEDVMPTFLDAAGAPLPDGLDGHSLLPLIRGACDRVREVLHSEHSPCYSTEQAFHALTDGRWKYIWRPFTGAEQLFDLTEDPGECRDLAPGDPDAVADWRRQLIDRLKNRPEGFTDGQRLVRPATYPGVIPGR
jgi:arylsulfatase A-like enzyme